MSLQPDTRYASAGAHLTLAKGLSNREGSGSQKYRTINS